MIPNNFLLFVQLITVLFITPGPQRILIITNSMNYGFPKSLWTGLGDVSANAIQMICATFGIYALISPYPEVLDGFKWIGGLYLIYLAVKFLKRKTSVAINKNFGTRSASNLFKDGFISAFFSPGAIIFFVVMFPTFLDPNNNFFLHFIILMTTHVLLDFFFLSIYAGVSSKIAIFLKNYPNLISRLSGCALLFLAYRILSTKINL
jgi:threonine/homoserine/homoserine lactone efflux protein